MALAETARLIASLELKDQFSAPAKRIEGSLGSLDRHLASTSSRAYKAGVQVGNGIRNAAKIAAGAAVIIGTASVGIFAKSIKAASSLNEVVSKVGVVFKDQAASILSFGKTSADALGLSQTAALSAAATYGNLFVSMGLSSKASATMSKNLVKLASDLASFNDIEPEEALEKLRAGLTGEAEPLKTLGINLNEQTLKAKALELGLVKLAKGQKQYTAVLDPATKAQAAYALIMEQSKTSQGDFGRTQDGLANQTRKLRANFTDLLTTLGTPTLPKIAGIFKRINAELKANQPAIARLGDNIAGLFSEKNIQAGFDAIHEVFDTAKKVGPVLIDVARQTASFMKVAVDAFRSLPPDIQKLAIGALAVNKLTGGLVTNVAGGIVGAILGKLRSAVVNVQGAVVNVGGVGGVGGVAGAAGAAGGGGLLGKLAKGALAVTVVGILAEAAVPIGKAFADFLPKELKGADGLGRSEAQTRIEAARAQQAAGVTIAEAITRGLAAAQGSSAVTAGGFDSRVGQSQQAQQIAHLNESMRASNNIANNGFNNMVNAIKSAKTGAEVRAAIKGAVDLVLTQGRGSLQATVRTLSALKERLKNVHDPKLRADLTAVIRRVENRLPARQFAAQQLDRLKGILADGKISNRELREVQRIEKALKDRGLPAAAAHISAKVKEAQRAQVAAVHTGTDVLRHKKFSPKIAITNNISTSVSVNALSGAVTTVRRYGNRYTLSNY